MPRNLAVECGGETCKVPLRGLWLAQFCGGSVGGKRLSVREM
jgi:hypothetical protein